MSILPSFKPRMRGFWTRYGQALWILPSISMIAGITLAAKVAPLSQTMPGTLGGLLTTGGAVGARDFIQTVAASTLTVTTITFSITVVALQVAAAQYSPRLPRQFIRDRGTQIVLSLFILTFVYSLSILRSIDADNEFVPQLAVSVAFLLSMSCVGAFVYFVNHIVHAIRVDQILRHVEKETVAAIKRNHKRREEADPRPEQPAIPDRAVPILAQRSAIIQRIEGDKLVEYAERRDIVVRLVRVLGEQVVAGAPLAWVWTGDEDGGELDPEEVRSHLMNAVEFGQERSLKADVAFGLTQLVDIALRALSTAVNDPTTACSSLRSAEVVLVQLCRHHLGDLHFFDDNGVLRVAISQKSFDDFLDLTVTPIRRTCPENIQVMLRLCEMLADVGRAAAGEDEQRAAVSAHLALVTRAGDEAIHEDADREKLRRASSLAEHALAGDPPRSI